MGREGLKENQTMQLSELSPQFMLAMALSMYRFEAHQTRTPGLLKDAEILEFYAAYMGRPA